MRLHAMPVWCCLHGGLRVCALTSTSSSALKQQARLASCPLTPAALQLSTDKRQALPYALALGPPFVLQLFFSQLFFQALDIAGTYGALLHQRRVLGARAALRLPGCSPCALTSRDSVRPLQLPVALQRPGT